MRTLAWLLALALPLVAEAPPGHNVHSVRELDERVFWRGGGPTRETMLALQARARQKGRPVTLIDLRHPPFNDDFRGTGARLTPAGEKTLSGQLGLRYRAINALDKNLIRVLDEALQAGDVYLHCQYGVNRTGFAVGRYATAHNLKVDRKKLGERDWNQGVRFQQSQ